MNRTFGKRKSKKRLIRRNQKAAYPQFVMIKLSVVIPTYNERENIPILIDRIKAALGKISHEIIVVDDDSPDRTWELVAELSEKDNNVRLIRRMSEKGLSSAVIEGFASAKGKYLAVIDADLQHDESILPEICAKLDEGFDLVIGSRKTAGGGIENWSYIRRFISFVAGLMAKILLRNNVSDPMSGYFALTRHFFQEVDEEINPRGFKILLELISRAKNKKITEVGYIFRNRLHGKSKLNTSVIIDYLIALVSLSLGRVIPARFLKYGLIGASGVIVNEGVTWGAITFFDANHRIALMAGIETSIITNYILNNFWTFYDYRRTGAIDFFWGLLSFNVVSFLGALINFSVALFLVETFSLNIYVANLCGILISTVWNYRMSFQVTWKRQL